MRALPGRDIFLFLLVFGQRKACSFRERKNLTERLILILSFTRAYSGTLHTRIFILPFQQKKYMSISYCSRNEYKFLGRSE